MSFVFFSRKNLHATIIFNVWIFQKKYFFKIFQIFRFDEKKGGEGRKKRLEEKKGCKKDEDKR